MDLNVKLKPIYSQQGLSRIVRITAILCISAADFRHFRMERVGLSH